jgi:hypothetical protein
MNIQNLILFLRLIIRLRMKDGGYTISNYLIIIEAELSFKDKDRIFIRNN